ncbi:hypothetical protein [Mesorhizobium sp.]|uniref:hypothetical protein n=1 Tax=Mesorhizobium sp. TaxID=1871066 RepID=UPI000FE87CA5|nr:hypothetical protein [Mesorhizobium sp.]RWC06042.1 MAG: hypothetical protein EOQ56_00255 [Mesorhizobium sp.]RWQ60969.1 MAG: hypothetical protein EOS83_02155 [Mesorhizobium sp.]
MPGDEKLSALTRSLITGVSLGGIALTQVGCVPEWRVMAKAQAERDVNEAEGAMCATALQSRSPRDINAFLNSYPSSRCIAPLLGAMPASVLAALSPSAIARLDSSVLSALPARVRVSLPGPRTRLATRSSEPIQTGGGRY